MTAPTAARSPAASTAAGALQSGFTLLEIMVVVVLISLTVTLVSINLDRDLDQIAHREAVRFARLLEHVKEESILTGRVYAIQVDESDKTYRFMESGEKWTPVKDDDLLRKRLFPEYLSVRFDALEARQEGEAAPLVVQGLGEVTPFQLVVSGDDFLHVVKMDEEFNVVVDRVARDES